MKISTTVTLKKDVLDPQGKVVSQTLKNMGYNNVVSEKKLDKDRFRKDLGNIIQAYQEVARRLGIIHEESNISEVKFGKPKAVNIKKK